MNYALLLDRSETEQRIRALAAQGWRIRDLASFFHLHPLVVERIIGAAR